MEATSKHGWHRPEIGGQYQAGVSNPPAKPEGCPLDLLCSLASTLLFAGARPGAVTLAVAPAVTLALALSAALANARSLAILSRAAIGANAAVFLEAFSLAGSALLFGLRRAAIAASIATTPGTLPLVLGEGRPGCEQSRSD